MLAKCFPIILFTDLTVGSHKTVNRQAHKILVKYYLYILAEDFHQVATQLAGWILAS